MRFSIILILILTTVAYGQRNSTAELSLPSSTSPGTVTLTLAEYNRLIELAARKTKTPDGPPIPFALSQAVFKLNVEDRRVTGGVDIDGAVLEKGSTKVPLISGFTLLDARQATSPLPLMQEGVGHAAIINGPGHFSISLNVAAPLTVEAGRASFVVPTPAATSSLLVLDLAGNHADVRIEPGLITSTTTANGRTIVEATLEPGKPSRIWWTTRETAAPVAQREVRFLSDIKSVVSVGDPQQRITALCDVTVVQGEPTEFRMALPTGFETTEATGSTLDSIETNAGVLVLKVREANARNHQFLIAIERTNRDTKMDVPVLSIAGAQRETGELLVEGVGAMELIPTESGALRRMDAREASAVARSLARYPLQAAFRYNRRAGDALKLQLAWTQFPDARVLSALAERATVTTLMNVEGKSLTEVTLRVRNHAQPFVKVELPTGATLVSAEVEGETVKPVTAPDGSRVPLMRAGFNPSGAYTVSFVYVNTGTRFAKIGAYDMGLPKLDIPINLLTWEVSLPDRLEVKQFSGNALAAELFPAAAQSVLALDLDSAATDANVWTKADVELDKLEAGQLGGIVVDPNGAVVANATITALNTQTGTTLSTRTDGEGLWAISGMQPGAVRVTIASPGFMNAQQELEFSGSRPARVGTTLQVGAVSATVTVTAGGGDFSDGRESRRLEAQARKQREAQMTAPSQNVFNLQRKVAGVLPVRIDVPRAGKSYRFVRPLVLEEETTIAFQYKSK